VSSLSFSDLLLVTQATSLSDEGDYIPLLPVYKPPTTLLVCDGLLCHRNEIKNIPIEQIASALSRRVWSEGLCVRKNDLHKILRYKKPNGCYKNDFDAAQFLRWVKSIEDNTVLCDLENKDVGKGVFVPRGKMLPKGTFIVSSGIIKLDPTEDELATKVHCSALQDFNTPTKKIYGLIDPAIQGGILNFINHAPDKNELAYFEFKNRLIKEKVATSNLISKIKFYNGYAIMGVEVFEDIYGGDYGTQLLWSYARTSEYLDLGHEYSTLSRTHLLLFDNRNEHQGKIIDPSYYDLLKINIFIDTGVLKLQKLASMTRWELMEDFHAPGFLTLMNPDVLAQPFLIEKKCLQDYLANNPRANRIILHVNAPE
jgi:hypothetical protein